MLEIKLSMPKDANQLTIVYHPITTQELRDKLWPLKLSYGDFQNVLVVPEVYNTLQVIAAHGPAGGIHAWAGIYYKYGNTYVGIFVEEAYRHQGLGGKLKDEAIKLCKAQGKDCIWQDRKNGDKWVMVKATDGTETIHPFEKFE